MSTRVYQFSPSIFFTWFLPFFYVILESKVKCISGVTWEKTGKSTRFWELEWKCLGNQNEMNAEQLKSAYERLKREVIEFSIPSVGDDFEPTKITSPSLNVILKKITDVSGLSNPITGRTLRTYFQAPTYSEALKHISFLAALWLENAKELTKQDCRAFYSSNETNSTYYWNEYLRVISANGKPKEPGPVAAEDAVQFIAQDISGLNTLFSSPEFNSIFERSAQLDAMDRLVRQYRLVLVDGIGGTCKKHFVRSLESKLINTGRYRRILWRFVEKNYSLDTLLQELGSFINLQGITIAEKAANLTEYLKANQFLLVLHGIEDADEISFTSFLKQLSTYSGSCQIILIRNNLSKFRFINSANILALTGYSLDEITSFCTQQNVPVTDDTVIQIRQISDGLPFYIELLIRAGMPAQNGEDPRYLALSRSMELENKIDEWTAHLNEEDKKLLHVLSTLERAFSMQELEDLGAGVVGISNSVASFTHLRDAHLALPHETHNWKIRQLIANYYRTLHDPKSNAIMHKTVAEYLSLNIKQNSFPQSRQEELLQIAKLCRHFQLAGSFEKSDTILQSLIPQLKRRNCYPFLYTLLHYEIEKNSTVTPWRSWHFAQCCYVLGRFKESFDTLQFCFKYAFHGFKHDRDNPEQVSYFLKTMQLFSELCGMAAKDDKAILLLSESLSIFDYSELSWSVRSQIISVLSGFYGKTGDHEKNIRMNNNLLNDDFEGTTQSVAIAFTHIGISYYEQDSLDAASEYLHKASQNFAQFGDLRGLAWSESYLVLTLIKQNKIGEATPYIHSVIKHYREGELYTMEYKNWLNIVSKIEEKKFASQLEGEIRRTDAIYQTDSAAIDSSDIDEQITSVDKFLKKNASRIFDLESFIHPLKESSLSLDAELSKTLIRKIRRSPESFLEKIRKKTPEAIFTDDITNKTIAECVKMFDYRQDILATLLLPNFEFITQLPKKFDTVKLHYARVFHLIDDNDRALTLLGAVDLDNQKYEYLNLKGNCLRKQKKFGQSDTYYEQACHAAQSDRETAIYNHNMALLILESAARSKYPAAIEHCLNAMLKWSSSIRFTRFVVNTLVLLEIELTPLKDVVEKVIQLKLKYDISDPRLQNIIREIADKGKREKLRRANLR